MNVTGLVDDLIAGRRGRRREVVELCGPSGDPSVAGALLDALALAAPNSNAARETLLEVVVINRLAERAVRKVLIDPADVDDAVQLSLVAVAERIGSYNGSAKFTTWLHSVARNEALMVLRRKQRKSEPSGDEVPEQHGFVRRLSSIIADQSKIAEAIARLPDQQREALVLREMDGLEYEEIARRLDVPIGTVRSRISRARDALGALLVSSFGTT